MKKGELLGAMLLIATQAHAGQFDKSGQPYILHPLTVMHKMETDDEELQAMAVGHDLFEDTKITAQDLRNAGMSDRVINGIYSVTKMPGETYEEYKLKVFGNRDGMLVKRADLLHNSDFRRLKGISQKDVERMARYQQFYYEIEQRLRTV